MSKSAEFNGTKLWMFNLICSIIILQQNSTPRLSGNYNAPMVYEEFQERASTPKYIVGVLKSVDFSQ